MLIKTVPNILYKSMVTILLLVFASCETLNQAGNIINQSGLINPTTAEIGLGLKEALEVGTNISAQKLSTKDGFLGNLAIKILFPTEAQKAEQTLRLLGFNALADNVILSINRAAEAATIEAKPIFIVAIKQMTITDASNILLSQQSNAATQYFKKATNTQLQNKFNPIIKASLTKVGATRYWADVVNKFNKIPFVTAVNPDLENYVTQKAIDGLFLEIANQELKIRSNISTRNGTLLKKVFGYADRNKVTNGL